MRHITDFLCYNYFTVRGSLVVLEIGLGSDNKTRLTVKIRFYMYLYVPEIYQFFYNVFFLICPFEYDGL